MTLKIMSSGAQSFTEVLWKFGEVIGRYFDF
jgi:hypothetical protein